jgi:hypothetical protein
MQKHVDETGRAVTPGAHALVILDKAGLGHQGFDAIAEIG